MRARQTDIRCGLHLLSVCLVALAMALFVPATYAQSASEPGSAGDFTQEEVQSVARASLAVERVNEEWAPRVQEATTQEEVNAIRRQANTLMVEAIEAEGLDINAYIEIIEMAQKDPELNERIMSHREALQ
jgi:hypothetical protein